MEVLEFRVALVLLHFASNQGLNNARLTVDKKVGAKVIRNTYDDSFVGEELARTVLQGLLWYVDKEGDECRTRENELGGILRNKKVQDRCLRNFFVYLKTAVGSLA